MSTIFVAAPPNDVPTMQRILGDQHQLIVVSTMAESMTRLENDVFDLILVGVHFDESRMFELLRDYRRTPENSNTPIICICTRDTSITRGMHEHIEVAVTALGAWMYLDLHRFNVTQDPDAEMKRIIERCLTGEERKANLEQRIDVAKQRDDLQQLRLALEDKEWSLNLEDQVVELRRNLSLVLLELCKLHVDNIDEQEQIAASRDLNDRVSEDVIIGENRMARKERTQVLDETKQSVEEVEIGQREETKRKQGRHAPDEKPKNLISQ